MPVSYTHLDVYKRQTFTYAGKLTYIADPERNITHEDCRNDYVISKNDLSLTACRQHGAE